jgi:hypothetical protein
METRSIILGVLAAMIVVCIAYLASPGAPQAPTVQPAVPDAMPPAARTSTESTPAVLDVADNGFVPLDSPSPIPSRKAEKAPPEAGLSELESRFRSTHSVEEKGELAGQIAGANNAQAVATLVRLFDFERHPTARTAVLSALGDVDVSEGLESRLAVLSRATQGQPKDVRNTALDLLESIEDQRATALIAQIMRNDPDREIRDAAVEIYKLRVAASKH